MLPILLAAGLPFTTAASGGQLGVAKMPKWFNRVPELLFAMYFGYAAFLRTGQWQDFLIGTLITFVAMEMGHGNFYHDGMLETQYPDRPSSLETYTGLHWLLPKLGYPVRSKWYCRILMALKGFLIGLPAFPFGLTLIVLWPNAYRIGFRYLLKDSAPAEWISGIYAMLVMIVAYVYYIYCR